MKYDYEIEVVHDESGKVVKRLEYSSERDRDKAYKGLIRQMNLGEYTASLVDPDNKELN
jgi:hypothetical protein